MKKFKFKIKNYSLFLIKKLKKKVYKKKINKIKYIVVILN